MLPEKVPLSVAIITKNEEGNLPDCLRSVSFADDIVVVVDSSSTDRTVEIAESFGCHVFIEDWKGDGPQKNSAIAKCKHEWVLVLDADERIPDETQKVIMSIVNDPSSADAYNFPRKNYFHRRWIRYCGWWPDRIIRFVKRSKGSFQAITHGKWATSGAFMETRSTDMARELFDAGKRANVFTPFLHGITMFLKIYIIKLGFLEGFDGFIISITRAGGSFFKYAKLLEIQNENKK
jgi:glycosyltransferase involved in cell wall biosynthesis